MASLATMWIDIVPRIKDLGTALNKAAAQADSAAVGNLIGEKMTTGIGDGLAKVGGAFATLGRTALAGAGIAAGAVAGIGKQAIDAYGQWEQAVGGVDTLFRDASGTVQRYAQDAYKNAGVSATEYMSQVTSFAASLVSSLGGNTSAAAESANTALADMSDNANKMGTDLSSLQWAYQGFAKQNYEMLDNLKLGYGGTKEEMQRLIADANRLGAAQGKTADLSINSFADVVEAIHRVQENLGITGTTSREAATTIEGSVGMMKASWSNWITEVGKDNADMQARTSELFTSVSAVASNVLPRVRQIAEGALQGIGQSLTQLIPQNSAPFAAAIPVVQQLAAGLTSGSIGLEQVGKSVAVAVAAFASFSVVGPMLASVGTALSGLAGTITSFFSPTAFVALFGGGTLVAALIAALLAGLGAIDTAMGGQLQVMVSSLLAQLPLLLLQVQAWVTSQLPALMATGAQLLASVLTGITAALPQIVATATAILTTLVQGITAALPTLLPAAAGMISTLVQSIAAQLPTIIVSGLQLLGALVQGILTAIPQLIAAVPQIVSTLTGQLAAHLPEIVNAGLDLLGKLVQGILNAIPQLVGAVPQIIAGFINGITPHLPEIIATGMELIAQMAIGLVQAIPQLLAAIPQIIVALGNAFTQVNWADVGKNILLGIASGITRSVGAIVDSAKNAALSALDSAKNALGIHSPSRLFRDEVGAMIGLGLAGGISDTEPTVAKNASQLAASTTAPFSGVGFTDPLKISGATTANVVPNTADATADEARRSDIAAGVLAALRAMPALQVMLDGRTLAGELAPDLDAALGERTYRGL